MKVVYTMVRQDLKSVMKMSNLLLLGLFISCVFVIPPYSSWVYKIKEYFGYSIPLVLIYLSSNILTKEFRSKTIKYLFNRVYPRSYVVMSKIISLSLYALVITGVYTLLNLVAYYLDEETIELFLIGEDFINSIIVYFCFTVFVGSLGLLVSIVTKSFSSTLILLFIMFIDIFKNLIGAVANEVNVDIIRVILEFIPFEKAVEGFRQVSYSGVMILVLLSTSLVLLLWSCILVENKDF